MKNRYVKEKKKFNVISAAIHHGTAAPFNPILEPPSENN